MAVVTQPRHCLQNWSNWLSCQLFFPTSSSSPQPSSTCATSSTVPMLNQLQCRQHFQQGFLESLDIRTHQSLSTNTFHSWLRNWRVIYRSTSDCLRSALLESLVI